MTLKMKWVALKLGLLMGSAQALEVSVEVQNLTHGIYFTPLLITAHDSDSQLFQLGQAASAELQAMAEGGDISGLVTQLESAGGNITANPAEGLLAPGAMTPTVSFSTEGSDNTHLSLVAMMLPTNDGFVGLDSWKLPESVGTYTVYLNAYDAGTEANDEIINTVDGGVSGNAGIPAAPGGQAGSGALGVTATEDNNTVHIHRGALGDSDKNGGRSDLDATVHRWLNPVAKLVVTIR